MNLNQKGQTFAAAETVLFIFIQYSYANGCLSHKIPSRSYCEILASPCDRYSVGISIHPWTVVYSGSAQVPPHQNTTTSARLQVCLSVFCSCASICFNIYPQIQLHEDQRSFKCSQKHGSSNISSSGDHVMWSTNRHFIKTEFQILD